MPSKHSAKDLIKERLNIQDVVSEYVNLKPSGNKMKGLSPFTHEKNPSFYVDPDAGFFYCFSTQKGGDIFTFIQEVEGVDFKEAMKILSEKAGVKLDLVSSNQNLEKEIKEYLQILKLAQEFFQKKINSKVTKYLNSRSINKESIEKFGIGYAPDSWNDLLGYLKNKGYKEKSLISAGLVVENKNRFYDRFRNRIMFPLFQSGKLIGFAGRTLGDDNAKYINSPETIMYNKSSYIYGLDLAKLPIRKHNFSILTEGYLDVILSNQSGFEMAVASSGTATTETHLKNLKKLSEKLIIAFDGDEAGINSAIKTSKMAIKLGFDVRIARLPEGLDPADVIANNPDGWRKTIRESKTIIDFLLDRIGSDIDSTKKMVDVTNQILPIVNDLKNNLLKEKYIDIISSFCGVSKEAILMELKSIKTNTPIKPSPKTNTQTKPQKSNINEKIKIFFQLKEQLMNLKIELNKKELFIIEQMDLILKDTKINDKLDEKYKDFLLGVTTDSMEDKDTQYILRRSFDEVGSSILRFYANKKLKETPESDEKDYKQFIKILRRLDTQ